MWLTLEQLLTRPSPYQCDIDSIVHDLRCVVGGCESSFRRLCAEEAFGSDGCRMACKKAGGRPKYCGGSITEQRAKKAREQQARRRSGSNVP